MIRPLSNQVLLEKSAIKTTISSTIIIPESAEKDHYEYTVVACGVKVPFEIKPGLRVVCSPWNGANLTYDGKDYWLVHFKECQMLLGVPAE